MLILILFSFFAGIVTILSPCILPILPIVLSGGITGGSKRPLGVVTGFVVSFTFFTLFLSALVRATGISADSLRFVSVIVVAAFGVSLLVPSFLRLTEVWFSKLARLASTASQKTGNQPDFVAGLFIGVSLGLVWTPCVGPILASIITLAATSQVTGQAVAITLAYSIGTALPLLAIVRGGRSMLIKHPRLIANSANIQKTFGVLMILTALAIYTNQDRKFQAYVLEAFPQYGAGLIQLEDNAFVRNALKAFQREPIDETKLGKPMFDMLTSDLGTGPELIPGGEWFNSDPLTLASLRGKVVLIDFWTYTCINCIRTLPYLKAWHEKYKDKGLVIIGVHTPEFEFEKNPENVAQAIEDFALPYAVMQDNTYATWTAYRNRYWPAKYLIDKNGRIRYTHFGEGAYDETEKVIQELLSEAGATVNESINNPSYLVRTRTPELYLGYSRIDGLISPERLVRSQPSGYTIPTTIPLNSFAYGGTWTVGDEYAMPARGAKLVLHFDATEVFLVMRPKNGSGKVRVALDGKIVSSQAGADVKDGAVIVESDRLYKLIKLSSPGAHILELEFVDDNVELYAFTFG